jgi:hypothetical protein
MKYRHLDIKSNWADIFSKSLFGQQDRLSAIGDHKKNKMYSIYK